MDIHNLTAKDRKKLHTWLRALIQLLYFLFIPSIYTAAFARRSVQGKRLP